LCKAALRSLRQQILAPAIEHYFGSCLMETTRAISAHACAAARDNYYLVFQAHV
jgi:hypothetical protein